MIKGLILALALVVSPAVYAGPFEELSTQELHSFITEDFTFKVYEDEKLGRVVTCVVKQKDPSDYICFINAKEHALLNGQGRGA